MEVNNSTALFNQAFCSVKAASTKLSLVRVNEGEEPNPSMLLHIVSAANGDVVSEKFTLEEAPALEIIGYFKRVAYKFNNNINRSKK